MTRTSRLLFRVGSAIAVAVLASRAVAQQPSAPVPQKFDPIDAQVIVLAQQGGPSELAISYLLAVPDSVVEQDYRQITTQLRTASVRPVIERKEFVNTSARVQGLVDWSTGVLQLDPILSALKRYRHFKVVFIFLGKIQVTSPIGNQQRGPIRWRTAQLPQSVTYDVWVDQTRGTPTSLPSTSQARTAGWWIGALVFALVSAAAVTGFFLYRRMRGQRFASAESEGR